MACAMLDASPLSSTGWNLAMAHAPFIQARCPRRSNPDDITPNELFFGIKPDLSAIRVFGAACICTRSQESQKVLFFNHMHSEVSS